jgi:hypothetical protein
MDPDLEKRYRMLLLAYDLGGHSELARLKQTILGHVLNRITPVLRPDAGLCLIVLYDHMILRPYDGYVPTENDLPGLKRVKPGGTPTFSNSLDQSLKTILDALNKMAKSEYSSHDVLRAIDETWSQLSGFFGWG